MTEGSSEVLEENDAKLIVGCSLRDFRSSGYKRVAWEIATGLGPQMLFEPMSLEILESEDKNENSFFEDFEQYAPRKASSYGSPAKISIDAVAQVQGPALEVQLQARFEEGRQAGIAEGKAAALKEIDAKLEEEKIKREAIFKDIQTKLATFFAETEKNALQFSLEVARELLEATAEAKPEYILDVIRKGLKATGSATPIKIKVSVADYEFLQIEGLPSDLTSQELGIAYVADESISSGCIIETNYGDVDLRLESMWEQMRENLREVFE